MRIEAFNKISQAYQTNSTKSTTKAANSSFRDKLEISQTGKDYQVAKQAVTATPDIREDKMNDIKQRMAAGTYNVNSQEVADKLVERYFNETV